MSPKEIEWRPADPPPRPLSELDRRLAALEDRVAELERVCAKKRPRKAPEYTPEEVLTTERVITYLSEQTGIKYRTATKSYLALVAGILADGYTQEDMFRVIGHRALKWKHDENMKEYLRPDVLLRRLRFPTYAAQAEQAYGVRR